MSRPQILTFQFKLGVNECMPFRLATVLSSNPINFIKCAFFKSDYPIFTMCIDKVKCITAHKIGKHTRTGRVSLGGLNSLPRIFFPLLARNSSGFARILPDILPGNGYLKNSRGAAAPPAPWAVRIWYMARRNLGS